MNKDTEEDIGTESQSGITQNDGFLNKSISEESKNDQSPYIYVHAPTAMLDEKRKTITEPESPALSEIPRNSQKDIKNLAPQRSTLVGQETRRLLEEMGEDLAGMGAGGALDYEENGFMEG